MPFKRISLSLLLSSLVLLSGCSDSNDDEKVRQKEKDTLVLGTSADMPPFEFYRSGGSSTAIVGFDIDVAGKIAEKLGKNLHTLDMDFSGLIPALKSGRVDFVMASMTPTPDRLKVVEFSENYLSLPVAVLSRPGVLIRQQNDLEGKKAGVQLGSSHEEYLKEVEKDLKDFIVLPMNKLGDIVQELKSGRIDAAIMETKVAREFQKNNPELQVTVLEGKTVDFAIALPMGSPYIKSINQAIEELRTSGELAKLQKKWF